MTFNGWTNYETWAVGMWFDGNYTGEGTYLEALALVQDAGADPAESSQALEELFREALPELEGIAADLIGSAVDSVNWNEITGHKVSEVIETWETEAKELGAESARAAASWIADGNTSADHIRALLTMLEEGDPAIDAFMVRAPDLSGEWADGLTPASLAVEVTGIALDEGELIDRLADAWEAGVGEAFGPAVEAELRRWIGEEVTK